MAVAATTTTALALLAAVLAAALVVAAHAHGDDTHDQDSSAETFDHVTFYSAIKLEHVPTSFRLHSHKVRYGSGSGQQSVTAVPYADDDNSLWLVMPPFEPAAAADAPARAAVTRRTSVACGSTVRLQHINTRTHLHSHLHESPLSANHEVSAFEGSDAGDNWEIECVQGGESRRWGRKTRVALKHSELGCYLVTSARHRYKSPISGHLEASCLPDADGSDERKWVVGNGIYFAAAARRPHRDDKNNDDAERKSGDL